VSLWITFNGLDGQWNAQKRKPRLDWESWRAFVDRILAVDRDGYVAQALGEHKRLVISLLEDQYLSTFFWQDPSTKQPKPRWGHARTSPWFSRRSERTSRAEAGRFEHLDAEGYRRSDDMFRQLRPELGRQVPG